MVNHYPSLLTQAQASHLCQHMRVPNHSFLFQAKTPYQSPDFTLDDLADILEVPKHHLYYCFQNILHTKFIRLRTEFRVEHAKKLLAEADFRRYTFDSIGREAGFASVSSFYQTFKNEVGCTPGAYAAAHNNTETYQGE